MAHHHRRRGRGRGRGLALHIAVWRGWNDVRTAAHSLRGSVGHARGTVGLGSALGAGRRHVLTGRASTLRPAAAAAAAAASSQHGQHLRESQGISDQSGTLGRNVIKSHTFVWLQTRTVSKPHPVPAAWFALSSAAVHNRAWAPWQSTSAALKPALLHCRFRGSVK
jgi:hypothetical protein